MSWEDDAACRTANPDIFYPDQSHPNTEAKRICATCPVTDPCLETALANDEQHGVWGGLPLPERRKVRRARNGSRQQLIDQYRTPRRVGERL